MTDSTVPLLAVRAEQAAMIRAGHQNSIVVPYSALHRGKVYVHAAHHAPDPTQLPSGTITGDGPEDATETPHLWLIPESTAPVPVHLGVVVATAALVDVWPLNHIYTQNPATDEYDILAGIEAQDPTDHDRGATLHGDHNRPWFEDQRRQHPLTDLTPGSFLWRIAGVQPINPVPVNAASATYPFGPVTALGLIPAQVHVPAVAYQ